MALPGLKRRDGHFQKEILSHPGPGEPATWRSIGFPSPARALPALKQPWGTCAAPGRACVTWARSFLAAGVVQARGPLAGPERGGAGRDPGAWQERDGPPGWLLARERSALGPVNRFYTLGTCHIRSQPKLIGPNGTGALSLQISLSPACQRYRQRGRAGRREEGRRLAVHLFPTMS